jgi:hypothetical protein
MKYNKKEERAIDTLFTIASNLKDKKQTTLTLGDIKTIKNELGIDFHESTKTKSEIKRGYRFVSGKSDLMLNYTFYVDGDRERFCYFPFQIKKLD